VFRFGAAVGRIGRQGDEDKSKERILSYDPRHGRWKAHNDVRQGI